jgi:hypothetical protein
MLGIIQYQTLRVKSRVKGRTVVALIDYDNTHNFIDSKLVKFVGRRVAPLQNLQVIVANDAMTNF